MRRPKPPTLFERVAAAARAGDVAAFDALAAEAPQRVPAYLGDALDLALRGGHRALAEHLVSAGAPLAHAHAQATSSGRNDDAAWLEARGAAPPTPPPPAPEPRVVLGGTPDRPFDLDADEGAIRSFLAEEVARWGDASATGLLLFVSAESGQVTVTIATEPGFDPVARSPRPAQLGTLSLPHWTAHHRRTDDEDGLRALVFGRVVAIARHHRALARFPVVVQDDEDGAVRLAGPDSG